MYRHALVLVVLVACGAKAPPPSSTQSSEPESESTPIWPVPPPMEGATMDEACYQQCMGADGVDPNGCWYDCNVRPPGPSSAGCYDDCMVELNDDDTCFEECECDESCY